MCIFLSSEIIKIGFVCGISWSWMNALRYGDKHACACTQDMVASSRHFPFQRAMVLYIHIDSVGVVVNWQHFGDILYLELWTLSTNCCHLGFMQILFYVKTCIIWFYFWVTKAPMNLIFYCNSGGFEFATC